MDKNNRQEALWAQYKEYERKTPMTGKERQDLEEWVAAGNSVYENGCGVFDDNLREMPYIEAMRFMKDLAEDEEYIKEQRQSELDMEFDDFIQPDPDMPFFTGNREVSV